MLMLKSDRNLLVDVDRCALWLSAMINTSSRGALVIQIKSLRKCYKLSESVLSAVMWKNSPSLPPTMPKMVTDLLRDDCKGKCTVEREYVHVFFALQDPPKNPRNRPRSLFSSPPRQQMTEKNGL